MIRCPNCKDVYNLDDAYVDKALTSPSDDNVTCSHCQRGIRRADMMSLQPRRRRRARRAR